MEFKSFPIVTGFPKISRGVPTARKHENPPKNIINVQFCEKRFPRKGCEKMYREASGGC
jgi:hypothetical protein